MAISVVLRDEMCNDIGEAIHDSDDVIRFCLPDYSDAAYPCLRFIDPYGDTIFNPLQARAVLDEWDRLYRAFCDHNADALWTDVRKLIVLCSEEPHTYLKFIGD